MKLIIKKRGKTTGRLNNAQDRAAAAAYLFSGGVKGLSKAENSLSAKPVVVVSLPVYKTPYHLFERALSSILEQHEVVVIVLVSFDGVSDHDYRTSPLLKDPRVVSWSSTSNQGPYFHHHVALLCSPTSLFAVQDSDDVSASDRLALLEREIRSKRADAAFASVVEHQGRRVFEPKLNTTSSDKIAATGGLVHRLDHFGLYRTDFLSTLGYYFGTHMGADTLLVNLAVRFGRCVAVPRAKYHRHLRAGSLTTAKSTGRNSAARAKAGTELRETWNAVRSLEEAESVASVLNRTRIAQAQEIQRAVSSLKPRMEIAAAKASTKRSARAQPASLPGRSRLDLALGQAPYSDWSITQQCARALFNWIFTKRPGSVVDFGSGVSTIVLGAYARLCHEQSKSIVRVLTLEHDLRHLNTTRAALAAAGLSEFVTLVHAPLAETLRHGISHVTYQFDFGMQAPYDFVFIDGPPQAVGRLGTLPSVIDHCADSWTCWLHDGFRDDERRIVAQWSKLLPRKFGFTVTGDHDSRGVTILESL